MTTFKPGDKVRLRSVADCPMNDQRIRAVPGATYTVSCIEPANYADETQRLYFFELPGGYLFGGRFELVAEAAEQKQDRELAAINVMVKALTGFDTEAARRVLSYGYNRFTK